MKAKITEPNPDVQAASEEPLARIAAAGIEEWGGVIRANTVLAGG